MVCFTAQFFCFGSERYLEGAGELPTWGTVCWQECGQQAEEFGYFPHIWSIMCSLSLAVQERC